MLLKGIKQDKKTIMKSDTQVPGNLISWQHHLFQSKDFNKLPVSQLVGGSVGRSVGPRQIQYIQWRLINSQAGWPVNTNMLEGQANVCT